MRDQETGSFWQQVSGVAISGPLAGQSLTLIPADHLTFQQWKAEQPAGTILKDVARDLPDYAPKPWEENVSGNTTREPVVGINAFGAARAWPDQAVLSEKLITDRIGSATVILVVGPDGKSIRAFRIDPAAEFFREDSGRMIDSATGNSWNFQGCTAGGTCLERVEITEDYWFNWLNYHPDTTRFHAHLPAPASSR